MKDTGDVVRSLWLDLPISTLSVRLQNLSKYTNYTIHVQGVTKFYGVKSSPIRIQTDEDGKII